MYLEAGRTHLSGKSNSQISIELWRRRGLNSLQPKDTAFCPEDYPAINFKTVAAIVWSSQAFSNPATDTKYIREAEGSRSEASIALASPRSVLSPSNYTARYRGLLSSRVIVAIKARSGQDGTVQLDCPGAERRGSCISQLQEPFVCQGNIHLQQQEGVRSTKTDETTEALSTCRKGGDNAGALFGLASR